MTTPAPIPNMVGVMRKMIFRSTGPVAISSTYLDSGEHTWTVESGSLPYHGDSDSDNSCGNEEEVCNGVGKVESLVNTHREFKFPELKRLLNEDQIKLIL